LRSVGPKTLEIRVDDDDGGGGGSSSSSCSSNNNSNNKMPFWQRIFTSTSQDMIVYTHLHYSVYKKLGIKQQKTGTDTYT